MVNAAKMLALTVHDLMTDPALVSKGAIGECTLKRQRQNGDVAPDSL
jgi:hypothetical protein